ncbi:hypothetical protein WA158_003181 [Blastocystis sp. Blastoise]
MFINSLSTVQFPSWNSSSLLNLPSSSSPYQYYQFIIEDSRDCNNYFDCQSNPFSIKFYSFGRYTIYINGNKEITFNFNQTYSKSYQLLFNNYTDEKNVYIFTYLPPSTSYHQIYNIFIEFIPENVSQNISKNNSQNIPFSFLVESTTDIHFQERSNYYFYNYTPLPTKNGHVPRTKDNKYIPDSTISYKDIISRYEFYNWKLSPHHLIVSLPYVTDDMDTRVLLSGYNEEENKMEPLLSFYPHQYNDFIVDIPHYYSIYELSTLSTIYNITNSSLPMFYLGFKSLYNNILDLTLKENCLSELINIQGAEINIQLCPIFMNMVIDIYPDLPSSLYLDPYTGYITGQFPSISMKQHYIISLLITTGYMEGEIITHSFTLQSIVSDNHNTLSFVLSFPYIKESCSIEIMDNNNKNQLVYSTWNSSYKQIQIYRKTDIVHVNVTCMSLNSFKDAIYYEKKYNEYYRHYGFFNESIISQLFELDTVISDSDKTIYKSMNIDDDKNIDIDKNKEDSFILEYNTIEKSTTVSISSCQDIEIYNNNHNNEDDIINQYTIYSPTTCKQYMPTSWEIYGIYNNTQVLLDRVHNQFWTKEGNEKKTFYFYNSISYNNYMMKIKLCLNTNSPSNSICPYISTYISSLNNTLLPIVLFEYKYNSNSLCMIPQLDYNIYNNSYYYKTCEDGYNGYIKYICSSELILVEDQCIYHQKHISIDSLPIYYINETFIYIQVIQSSDKQIRYSITPKLPEGVILNKYSGIISGIPLEIPQTTLYTIIATTLYNTYSQQIILNIIEKENRIKSNHIRRLRNINNEDDNSFIKQKHRKSSKRKNKQSLFQKNTNKCKGILYYNERINECDICTNGILIHDNNRHYNIGCKLCLFDEYSDGNNCIKKSYCKQQKEWPKTLVNSIAYLSCGNNTHEGYRSRQCLEGEIWDTIDNSQCRIYSI